MIQVREAQVADGGGQAVSGVRVRAVRVNAEGGRENEGHHTGGQQPQKGQVHLLSLNSLLLNLSIIV
jgi:hypothetical protein